MVKQYGKRIAGDSDDGNVKTYMCGSTDASNTWPTDCGDGSTMTVINETTHAVASYHVFFNGNWNTI